MFSVSSSPGSVEVSGGYLYLSGGPPPPRLLVEWENLKWIIEKRQGCQRAQPVWGSLNVFFHDFLLFSLAILPL